MDWEDEAASSRDMENWTSLLEQEEPVTNAAGVAATMPGGNPPQAEAQVTQQDDADVVSLAYLVSSSTIGNRKQNMSSKSVSIPEPSSGEVEQLFWKSLEKELPEQFSTKEVRAKRVSGSVRITNPHVLVTGCPIGTTYRSLFGTMTQGSIYWPGAVVNTLERIEPLEKKRAEKSIAKAKEYLREAYLIRRRELRKNSPSYKSHLHMVHVVKGTLDYLEDLCQSLSPP